MFPVNFPEYKKDYALKTPSILVKINGAQKIYPFPEIENLTGESGEYSDSINGSYFRIIKDGDGDVKVENTVRNGNDISVAYSFWFALRAAHPETPVFDAELTSVESWSKYN